MPIKELSQCHARGMNASVPTNPGTQPAYYQGHMRAGICNTLALDRYGVLDADLKVRGPHVLDLGMAGPCPGPCAAGAAVQRRRLILICTSLYLFLEVVGLFHLHMVSFIRRVRTRTFGSSTPRTAGWQRTMAGGQRSASPNTWHSKVGFAAQHGLCCESSLRCQMHQRTPPSLSVSSWSMCFQLIIVFSNQSLFVAAHAHTSAAAAWCSIETFVTDFSKGVEHRT